jgi:EmrB/QacA subfamily drug resistance transporter
MRRVVEGKPLPPRQLNSRDKRQIVIAVMLAMFLGALDSTIVAPALPTIGAKLGGDAFLPWIVSAYFVTSTAATPLYGKISDIHGRRPVVLFSLGLFLLGSLACALSPSIGVLIVARALQGLGGGGLVAMSQAVVADIATPVERAQYTVYISTVWAAASVAGPALGGFLAQHISWTMIFWLNLPIGGFAFYVCERLLRDLPQARRRHRLDWLGGALVVGATVALMLMLTLGGDKLAWTSPTVLGLGAAALGLGGWFVAHLTRAPEPLIPPSIFANRVVDKASLAMFFGMLVNLGAIVYVPLYFELCLRLDATASGLGLIVLLCATVVGSNFTGMNLPKVRHYKSFAYAGVASSVAALALLAALAGRLDVWGAEGLLLVYGIGLGTLFPTLTVCVQNAADPRDIGAATATLAFVRALGSALGVAVFGAVIFAYGVPADNAAAAAADPQVARAAFRAAFGLMSGGLALCLAFFIAMEEVPLRGPAKKAAMEAEIL